VAVTADKMETATTVARLGWAAMPSWTEVDAALDDAAGTVPPVDEWAVKPRFGSGSSAVLRARGGHELRLAYDLLLAQLPHATVSGHAPDGRDVLIQPWLQGVEYGLDVVNDLDGRHVTTFVKRKLSMRAGETDRAVTVDLPHLADLGRALGDRFAHPGVMDVDVIVDAGVAYVLECNPRFGGGYPFSHLAGADVPRAMLAWLAGREPEPSWLNVRAGVVGSKYDLLTEVPSP
jgi:carbamoyl-phosphate synthase large subunit